MDDTLPPPPIPTGVVVRDDGMTALLDDVHWLLDGDPFDVRHFRALCEDERLRLRGALQSMARPNLMETLCGKICVRRRCPDAYACAVFLASLRNAGDCSALLAMAMELAVHGSALLMALLSNHFGTVSPLMDAAMVRAAILWCGTPDSLPLLELLTCLPALAALDVVPVGQWYDWFVEEATCDAALRVLINATHVAPRACVALLVDKGVLVRCCDLISQADNEQRQVYALALVVNVCEVSPAAYAALDTLENGALVKVLADALLQ